MSSDNGIFIAKFPDGFRFAYGVASHNLDFYPEGSKKRKKELKLYFGKSEIYSTEELAFVAAREVYKKMCEEDEDFFTEYGICYIGEYENF